MCSYKGLNLSTPRVCIDRLKCGSLDQRGRINPNDFVLLRCTGLFPIYNLAATHEKSQRQSKRVNQNPRIKASELLQKVLFGFIGYLPLSTTCNLWLLIIVDHHPGWSIADALP